MPESYSKHRRHPGKPIYALKDAAKNKQLVMIRCGLCRRSTNFLASDLVKLLDPERPALDVPFPCSKCGKTDYIDVKLRVPQLGDYGTVTIRRPAGVRRTQLWRSVKLGDE